VLQQSLSAEQNVLVSPLAMHAQLPSLAQNRAQQSESDVHGSPSATHAVVVHAPSMHSSPPQLVPQAPQFSGSLERSAHTPSQSVKPPQSAVAVTVQAVLDANTTTAPAANVIPKKIFLVCMGRCSSKTYRDLQHTRPNFDET
jgi:hypothetical protein